MARERTAYETLAEAHNKVLAERDTLRALWLEWLEGTYDGRDLLRRVKLAVHGPLRKPGNAGVRATATTLPGWVHDCPYSTGQVLLPMGAKCSNCGAIDGVQEGGK